VYEFKEVPRPFTPTPALSAHLEQYRLEYGAVDRPAQPGADSATVWRIASESSTECGYAWWLPRSDESTARDIHIAIFDSHAGKGAAAFALKKLEEIAAGSGVTVLCGQVNSNSPKTGLKVRLWLERQRFVLFDRSKVPFWPRMSNADYLRKFSAPVHLRKSLAPAAPAPGATPQMSNGGA